VRQNYGGTLTWEAVCTGHRYINGFCANCDAYEPCGGSGTEVDPYTIANAGQLYWYAAKTEEVSGKSKLYAVLIEDVVVNENVLDPNGELIEGNYRDWTPINERGVSLDGRNHTISGLYVNRAAKGTGNGEYGKYVGLFGEIDDSEAVICNVGIVDSYFSGSSYVGAVAGESTANISNCWSSSRVIGESYVGGIVGYVFGERIRVIDCYNSGHVSGEDGVGGIIGYAVTDTTVTGCYNTGNVNSESAAGGIIGATSGCILEMKQCYNTGAISGSRYIGGIGGDVANATRVDDSWLGEPGNPASLLPPITCCYNTGTISGETYVGGIAGAGCYISSCYSIGAIVNTGDSYDCIGAIAGDCTLDELMTYYNCYDCYYPEGIWDYGIGYIQDYLPPMGEEYYPITWPPADMTNTYPEEAFASGEVCSQLGLFCSHEEPCWGQNIDNGESVQAYPVFSDAVVYQVQTCDGSWTYSNTEGNKDHVLTNENNHVCSVCGDPVGEHSYTAVVTPATCTEVGYTTYTCACGDSYVIYESFGADRFGMEEETLKTLLETLDQIASYYAVGFGLDRLLSDAPDEVRDALGIGTYDLTDEQILEQYYPEYAALSDTEKAAWITEPANAEKIQTIRGNAYVMRFAEDAVCCSAATVWNDVGNFLSALSTPVSAEEVIHYYERVFGERVPYEEARERLTLGGGIIPAELVVALANSGFHNTSGVSTYVSMYALAIGFYHSDYYTGTATSVESFAQIDTILQMMSYPGFANYMNEQGEQTISSYLGVMSCLSTGSFDMSRDDLFANEGFEYLQCAPSHTRELVSGYAATCTEPGLTDGVKCSVCGEILVSQNEIPTLGHSFESYEPDGNGLETATCANGCGETHTRVDADSEKVELEPDVTEDTKAETTVDKELLEEMAGNTEKPKSLHLNSDILDLVFNYTALQKIVDAFIHNTTISVVVKDNTADVKEGLVFDIYLNIDGEDRAHTEFGEGEVTVTIPVGKLDIPVGKRANVYYVDGDSKTPMDGKYVHGGNTVEFRTNHFSTYTVLVEDCFDHEYGEDDTCTICGTEKTENPPAGSEGDDIPVVPEPMKGSIRLRSATLNLLDKVCIVYGVTDDNISTNPEEVAVRGVLLYDSAEKAATKDPTQAYAMVEMEWSEKDKMYRGQTEGIDARDMNKSQFAVAYLKLVDGTEIFGTKNGAEHIVEYSPLIYCQNKKDDALVGTLCRALMHYGAAAQVSQYPDDPGPLMNEGFEVIAYDESVLGENVFEANTQKINGMKLKAVTLDLKGAISYIVKYEADASVTADKALYAEYILAKKNGTETGSVELVKDTSGGTWSATISGVPPKDMGATLTVKPYYLDENGEKVYGGELVYSGYEYVRRAQANANYAETTKELARALAMYIDAANAYGNKA